MRATSQNYKRICQKIFMAYEPYIYIYIFFFFFFFLRNPKGKKTIFSLMQIPASIICYKASLQLILGLEKFLGTPRARNNGVPFSHIYGRPHNKFNEWTPLWMWEKWASFSALWVYQRISRRTEPTQIQSHSHTHFYLLLIYLQLDYPP